LRWSSSSENNNNKSNNILLTIKNETKTISEWAKISGVNKNTITDRIKRGWQQQDLLNAVKKAHTNTKKSYIKTLHHGIKKRCYNKNCKEYHRYGGRGITMYSEWIDNYKLFEEYILTNLGPRPTNKHELDRYPDNDKGYFPQNLRWATRTENNRNKSNNVLITFNGKIKTLSEWSEIFKIRPETIQLRIKRGWTDDKLFSSTSTKKFDEENIKNIKLDISNGNSIRTLAKKYNTARTTIQDIIHERGAYKIK
jgi:hypothetical protein